MYSLYLVTGATGYLGSTVVRSLLRQGAKVRALALPNDRLVKSLPQGAELSFGSVDNYESLSGFFEGAGPDTCVIHCAGIVSIASRNDDRLWRVNVAGTMNIANLSLEKAVGKLVYVSSVHAIPEKPRGQEIAECRSFSPESVVGDYAKSKAAATEYILCAARRGLNASVVHPSGIIGPYDSAGGSVTGTVISYCRGKLLAGVRGGYDFVDVRDVAEGILSCCEKGRQGECYILSGRYTTVPEVLETLRRLTRGRRILMSVPLGAVKLVAPLCEKVSLRRKTPPFLTPYSVYTMGVNALFSHEKATRELDYHPRDLRQTLSDMVQWLKTTGKLSPLSKLPRKRKLLYE